MEIQTGSSNNIIAAAKLKTNELASALVIGTRFGSAFTRSDDALLFENLATAAGVRVQELPPWLQRVHFTRTTLMHGENMRHIAGITAMSGVQPSSLEGLATFVTLCCQWTQAPHLTSRRLVRDLITGELGPVVHPGSLRKPLGATASKLETLLDKFIRATMESDAKSPQSMKVQNMLAELSVKAGRVSFEPIRSDRLLASDKRILTSLLGGDSATASQPAVADPVSRDTSLGYPLHKDSRVHDTVSVCSASIALAAAANNADVYVECHVEGGVFYLPKRPSSGLHDSLAPIFLTRLWLCQPPSYVSNMINMTGRGGEASAQLDQEQEDEHTVMCYPTIFGGQAELTRAVANILRFQAQYALVSREEAISILWHGGRDYGARLHLKRSTYGPTDFYLEPPPGDIKLDESATPLTKIPAQIGGERSRGRWHPDARNQGTLLRATATVIHQLYGIDDYEKEELTQELLAASAVVKFSMTVGILHRITHNDDGEMSAYAVNSSLLQEEKSLLWDFLPGAIDFGIGTLNMILATSSLWTGTTAEESYPIAQRHPVSWSPRSSYGAASDRTVLGKIGPHGVVLLEVIRDPVQFSIDGLSGPLIYFTRGSVPLLARDSRDGYLYTSNRAVRRTERHLRLQSEMAQNASDDAISYPDPVITIEPDTSNELRSTVFCAWYRGDLAFEIDPLRALLNVTKGVTDFGKSTVPRMKIVESQLPKFDYNGPGMRMLPHEQTPDAAWENGRYTRGPKRFPPRLLTPLDFLKEKGIILKRSSAVFRACSPTWLLCASGLVVTDLVSVTREKLSYQDVLFDEGQIIIEYVGEGK